MTKILLKDSNDFDIQKDIWKTYGITDINGEFNRPLEYPCVMVFSIADNVINTCFVYNSDLKEV